MTLALLYDNKGLSAICQQKFRRALTLKYLYGLNSFNEATVGFGDAILLEHFPCLTNAKHFADWVNFSMKYRNIYKGKQRETLMK